VQLITLDFESFYSKDYSLSKLTTEQYITDIRFEVIGVSTKINHEPAQWFSGTFEATRDYLNQFDWDDIALVNHNSLFDSSILGLRFDIHPKKLIDTLSMARAVFGIEVGGSLAKLSEHYQLGAKGTEVINALGKRRLDFTTEELARYGEYCKNDTELTYKLLYKLLPHFTKSELDIIDITLKMATRPLLELDKDVLTAHLADVQAKKQALMDKVIVSRKDLMSNVKLAALLTDCGVEVPMKLSPATGKPAYAFAKTDEGFKALLDSDNLMVQTIVAARLGVKSTLEETRTERFIGIAERNKQIPVPLKYYGAETGRFSGMDKINFQNFPRGSDLRKAFRAPEGHVIVGADLSNIELRVALWLAGEWGKLQDIKEGLDLYKVFAAKAYGVEYDDVDKTQRFIGKTAVLGLQYQVGGAKLQATVRAGSGLDMGIVESKRIVELYREEYAGIKAAWAACGRAIIDMANDHYSTLGTDGLLLVEGAKGIRYPSGLYMKYPQLQLSEDGQTRSKEYKYKIRNGWDKLYPGKCFNASVQGTARCVMTEVMPRISKQYPIVLSIHDALYIIAPEDEAQAAQDFLIQEMCRPPAWMPDCPLNAEGHYGKTLYDC
jgi:DNA polymerase I-like protein with 3'-5' exonuclease and polymerase domains